MDDDTRNKSPDHIQDHLHHHQPAADETEEEEEALSLSGLILNSDEFEFQDRSRSSSSDPSEFFEFFSYQNSETMSHAEDIIFCGKLIPYQENPPHVQYKTHNSYKHQPTRNDQKQQSFHRRRSESLNDINTSRSNGAKNQVQFMRSSRSLDYQKLYGNNYNSSSSSSASTRAEKEEIERSPSTKSSGKGDATWMKEKITRPRWYMMFGLVKFPPEMAYQDIKSRQVRRNPGNLFTSLDSGEKAIVNRPEDRRWLSSWDLLRVLSCKDHASVAVTASFGCLQQSI